MEKISNFETLRHDMHVRYGHEHSAAEIDTYLDQVIAKHEASARLDEFVPVLVEREVREHFGDARPHVRFAAGQDHALARVAAVMTRTMAGGALYVDTAREHPENAGDSQLNHVMAERGLSADNVNAATDVRMVEIPDYIVYLGREVPRDEAGKDVKIWDITRGDSLESSRELADDLQAHVQHMLNRLGIEPVEEKVSEVVA